MKDEYKDNIIVNLTFEFALNIIDFCEMLNKEGKFEISKQLLRSGTSIGANVREAQNAESRSDFIHKLKISAKEAEETEYWLLLCKHSDHLSSPGELISELEPIKKVITKIISSSKSKI
ncbi:MAG: four helix bundle protein [Marinilabiliaceae bacterium]|jgi:four helix bundle protein|nr:four helix bundle protein [Marinilabiliaceae bacterium]